MMRTATRVVLVGIALVGCDVEGLHPRPATPLAPSLSLPSVDSPARSADMLAVVVEREAVTVGSKHPGRVATVRVRVGQQVARGDVLAILAKRDAQDEVALTQAKRDELEAALAKTTHELERAAQLAEEAQRLFESGALSQDRLRDAKLARAAALSEQKRRRAQLEEQRVRVRLARSHRAETAIVAPADGWVAEKFVESGSVVNPGSPIVRLLHTTPTFDLRFAAPPDLALQTGQAVEVHVESTGEQLVAAITHVAPSIEPLTGFRIVRATSHRPAAFPPGTALRVTVSPEHSP